MERGLAWCKDALRASELRHIEIVHRSQPFNAWTTLVVRPPFPQPGTHGSARSRVVFQHPVFQAFLAHAYGRNRTGPGCVADTARRLGLNQPPRSCILAG